MVTAVTLAGSGGLLGAGSATADPAPRTLTYTCSFPLIGGQRMTASVVWTAPDTHVVGQATSRSPVSASATVGSDVTRILRFAGAATVEGTADVSAVVAAPQGDIPVDVRLKVPRSKVPGSGPLTVPAKGTLPSLVFSRPGPAKIFVGEIDLHLVPRDTDGDETRAGTVDAPCDLDSGQDGFLAPFTVERDASGPAAPGTPSGTPSAYPGAPGAASPDTSPVTSPAASESGGTGFAAPPRAVAAVAAVVGVGAAVFGAVWWSRRRREEDRDG
ncbi:DUF6801 domain-containing protein [Streptomyces bluensis]|uniref:DUF6801 domain-containing protein n=1 Tax=Streptomyces bluensis TaxID=33897 RepID=UPI00332382A3